MTKVTDFGLAKQLDLNDDQTRTGELRGTPNYMAPEQAAGDIATIGYLTDVYAIGAILYFLVTGRAPFAKHTLGQTLQSVIHDQPPTPTSLNPSCPKDLETICLKCLSKLPADRYDSAAALRDDLKLYLSGAPIHARPVSSLEKTWRWCQRNPVTAGLTSITVLLVLGIVLGGVYFANVRSRDVATNAEKLELANQFDDALASGRVTTVELMDLERVGLKLSQLDPQRNHDRTQRLLSKATADAIDKLSQPRFSPDLEEEIEQRIDWLQERDQAAADDLSQRLADRRRNWRTIISTTDLLDPQQEYVPRSLTEQVGDQLVSKFPITKLGPSSRIPLQLQIPVPQSLRVNATFAPPTDNSPTAGLQVGVVLAGEDALGHRSEIEFLVRQELRHIPPSERELSAANPHQTRVRFDAAWTHPAEDALVVQPAFAFSPDGRFIAFADGRHALKVVETASGKLVQRVDGLTDAGFAPVFEMQSPGLAGSTVDQGNLNPLSNPYYELAVIGIAPIRVIRFTPSGQQRDVLALSGLDDTLGAVSRESKQVAIVGDNQLIIKSWQDPSQTVSLSTDARMIAISPEGTYAAFVTSSGGVFLWNLNRGSADQITHLSGDPAGLHFLGDGRVLFVAAEGAPATLVDVDTGVTVGTSAMQRHIACSPPPPLVTGSFPAPGARESNVLINGCRKTAS